MSPFKCHHQVENVASSWCAVSLDVGIISQGIDAQSLTRILMGLAKCGAWGCFDEFNRLEEATLSAISMQVHRIQEALRTNAPTVQLLGQEVSAVLMWKFRLYKWLFKTSPSALKCYTNVVGGLFCLAEESALTY